jgi:hypothetical protein
MENGSKDEGFLIAVWYTSISPENKWLPHTQLTKYNMQSNNGNK